VPIRTHNKLVRDKIPERIEASGERAVWKTVAGADFRHVLLMKVIEEAREYMKKPNIEEEADLQEIFLKIRSLYGYTGEDVELARKKAAVADATFGEQSILSYAADYIKIRTAEAEAPLQQALAHARVIAGYTPEDVETFRVQKAETHGAFEAGIYLEYVE
jgi:predicted house-cleaning noncanonical NTP pyrophosphatase (MazG superfamily)